MSPPPTHARKHFLREVVHAMTALVLAVVVFIAAVGNLSGAAVLSLGAVGLFGLQLTLERAPHRAALAAHLVVALLYVAAVVLAVMNAGGLGAPALFVLPVIPLLAAFLIGPRAAIGWTAAALLPPVAMFVLAAAIPAPRLAPHMLDAMRLLAPMSATAMAAWTALSYERHVRRQAEMVDRARQAAERARAEAEAANRAKSAFLATMSHEIRTPMAAVLGITELLEREALTEAQNHKVELLGGAGRTMLALVDDILDLSRIEAGHETLTPRPMDLAAVVRDVGELIAHQARDAGLELVHTYEGPPFVEGDPLRLRQILLNLAVNAVKYTEEGQVRIEGRGVARGDAVDIILTVSDTGPGIRPEHQAQVFQPFFQDPATPQRQGTGLGLTIVSRLVQQMGGSLSLQSTEGEGTTFGVQLTLPSSDDELLHDPTAPHLLRLPRVLLAEDNPVTQQVLRMMLETTGCTVDIVGDGRQAVDAILQAPPEVVLMDCQMPHMDGLEATRTLRAEGFEGPIIALTANATADDRRSCLDAGMTDFASKPITLQQLRTMLTRWAG